jgi:Ser/Thr protein kinase RdoA (MazF antagonist)
MSTSFNFFERGALPRPEVSPAEAEELVRTRFGVEGRAVELGSQQDANFRIDTDAGTFVLKVSNPAFGAGDLDAQDRAAAHVAALEPDVLVPEAVPGVDGRTLQPIDVGGEPTTARLVRYVEGRMLSESAYLAPPIVAALGDLAGRTTRALAGFEAELPQRELQWDLRHAEEVVTRLASYVGVPGGGEAVQRAAAEAGGALVALTQVLPVQPIHGDLTDDNVVAVTDDDGRLRPVGVIDFGDLVQSWAVGELAVTLSSVLAYAGDDLARLLPAVRAFDAVRPLSDAELAALWPLTVLRAAALMVSGQHQASIDRGNEYAAKNLDREWRIFEVATSVPPAVGTELLRSAVRAARPSTPITGTRLLEVPARAVDLSTTSPELDGGVFLDDEDALLGRLLGGEGVLHTRYLEPRLTRTAINSLTAPATVPLGVDVRSVSRVAVRAPWAGRLSRRDGAVTLETAGRTLWLDGDLDSVADGDVAAGDTLGDVTALRVQLGTGAARPPYFVPAGVAHAWRVVCPDPTPLLEHAAGGGEGSNAEEWLARRDAAFATVRRRGPLLSRHAQQRLDPGARPSPALRRGRAAVAPAQHQLAVPLPRGRGVLRAARGAGSGPARHGVPGQQRLGGGRPRAPARVGQHRPSRRGLDARGLPRLDRRDRRRLHLGGRQPQRVGDPPAVGAHGAVAEPLPRHAPRCRGAPVRRRGGRRHRGAGVRGPPARGVPERVVLRQRGRDGAARRLPGRGLPRGPRRRRALHRRRGTGRLRPARCPLLGL